MLFGKKENKDEDIIQVLSEIRDNISKGENINNLVVNLDNKIEEINKSINKDYQSLGNDVVRLDKQFTEINVNLEKENEKKELLINDLEIKIEKMNEKLKKQYKINKIIFNIIQRLDDETNPINEISNSEDEETSDLKDTTYRQIVGCDLNINNIESMTEEGYFKRKTECRGRRTYSWNIKHLLLIKKLIPKIDEFPSMKSISKKVGLSSSTVSDLVYCIEKGWFNKYFNEWEQIEAKKMNYNWKPKVENNPQKRVEKGMI